MNEISDRAKRKLLFFTVRCSYVPRFIHVSSVFVDPFLSTTGATSGAGTAFPSGIPEFITVFFGVCVTQSLVLCACFVDRCLSFCTFTFGHCVVCSSSMYGFRLSLWYLSTHFFILCYNYVYKKSLTIPKR